MVVVALVDLVSVNAHETAVVERQQVVAARTSKLSYQVVRVTRIVRVRSLVLRVLRIGQRLLSGIERINQRFHRNV